MLKLCPFVKVALSTVLFTMLVCQNPAFAWNKAGHMVSGAIACLSFLLRMNKKLSITENY
ncbi:hypothetical protein [Nostoc sp. NIES-3756]|uniref:hypothetical protein n=1 Tax=Nostoc sp. NIES-3756 TaxID=1751286 RepID=UPI0011E02999|nr:hypothetical protein [Nostoc sp. NIES-3756]